MPTIRETKRALSAVSEPMYFLAPTARDWYSRAEWDLTFILADPVTRVPLDCYESWPTDVYVLLFNPLD